LKRETAKNNNFKKIIKKFKKNVDTDISFCYINEAAKKVAITYKKIFHKKSKFSLKYN